MSINRKNLLFFSDYKPSVFNDYWLEARRVDGSGNPGNWNWEDGSDVNLTSE